MFRNLSSGFVLIINELSKMTDTDNTYNNIEELLPRFCEGMTTAAESRLVEEWIEQDESHRKIMNQIHALYLATDTLHVMKRH